MNQLVQLTDVIEELKNRQYNIKEKRYVQNGVTTNTIAIDKDEWKTTYAEINVNGLITSNPSKSAKEIADMVEFIISTHDRVEHSIDTTFILENIHTAFQKISDSDAVKTNDDVISRPTKFDGIEEYLCIYSRLGTDKEIMLRVSPKLLKDHQISEDDAWAKARHNNRQDTTIIPATNIVDDDNNMPVAVYIVTNKIHRYGAAAVIDKALLRQLLGTEHNKKWIVALPSVHQAILIPDQNKNTQLTDNLLNMFNNGSIEQIDRLTDKTYMAVI